MADKDSIKTIFIFLFLVTCVIGLSILSNMIWEAKPEKPGVSKTVVIESEMTVRQFGTANNYSDSFLKEIFQLKSKSDFEKIITNYGSSEEIISLVAKENALSAEATSKNWKKIAVKFALWFIFLLSVFIYFRKHTVTANLRKLLLFVSLLVFGVILGSDPAPMGTVKDAIYLFAEVHTVFPPRMVALFVFLLMVFFVNKYICAWGCQAGTLQDLVFRLNRNNIHKPKIWKQFKLPFAFTNTFRAVFFFIFVLMAFMSGIDIIEPVDFFRIYKPAHLGLYGSISAGSLLLISLFIYRPWCHLFCPFGLVGWLVEKISLIKINVNYNSCIACKKCVDACPSSVMNAILLNDRKTIPDCFACYTCRDVCPTRSISFSAKKRTPPPEGYFEKRGV